MLPKWHILFGFIFSYIIYGLTSITIFQAILIFLASVFIDFDHYLWGVIRKKDLNLKRAYFYLKKVGTQRHKPRIDIFHTIEFHIFVAILVYFFNFFIFILIGMLFHSILDIIDLINRNLIRCREFSLIKYLISDKNKYF